MPSGTVLLKYAQSVKKSFGVHFQVNIFNIAGAYFRSRDGLYCSDGLLCLNPGEKRAFLLSADKISFRRETCSTSGLIESYCGGCGVFISAARDTRLLATLEQQHYCRTSDEKTALDDLLLELAVKETDLREWISRSEQNSRLFAADPMSAIRAAELGFDERVLHQLESVMRSIARKLRQP